MAASILIYWYMEKTWSVRSINSIVEPKKPYGEFYNEGELVQAKFQNACYPGMIIKIAPTGESEMLKKLGEKLEKVLQRCGDLLPEEVLLKLKEEEGAVRSGSPVIIEATLPMPTPTVANTSAVRATIAEATATCSTVRATNAEATATSRTVRATNAEATATSSTVRATNAEATATSSTVRATNADLEATATNTDNNISTVDGGCPPANDYLSSPVHTSSNRHKRSLESRVRDMEKDMKSMRKRIRVLEQRLEESSVSSCSGSTAPAPSRPVVAVPNTISTTPPATLAHDDIQMPVPLLRQDVEDEALTVSSLVQCVQHIQGTSEKNITEIVRCMVLKCFTSEDLVNRSRTGKRTNKSGEVTKPPLDSDKLLICERAFLEKCPSTTKDVFIKKFENIQKVERRKAKV